MRLAIFRCEHGRQEAVLYDDNARSVVISARIRCRTRITEVAHVTITAHMLREAADVAELWEENEEVTP